MFSKTNPNKPTPAPARKAPQKSVASAPSILGPDIKINGDISSDGDIQIDGHHEGNIVASKLTVGEQGSIMGSIKARTVHVRGKVTGKITATVVDLSSTANVQADIIQDQLTIANGAFFDGKCARLTKTPVIKANPAAQAVQAASAGKPVNAPKEVKKTA